MISHLPHEVLSRHDGGGDGVAEGLELDPVVLLEELLAEEHVEVLVSLVRHVDDVGVLSWLGGLDLFHFSKFIFCKSFNLIMRVLYGKRLINYYK